MQLNWSGYVWNVYFGKMGAFYYLEENVYLDNDNKLHLKTKIVNGITYGGMIQAINNNFSYGTYILNIISNVVLEHMFIDFEVYIPNFQGFAITLTDGGSHYHVGHSGKRIVFSPDFYFTKPNTTHKIIFNDNNLYFESSPDIYSWTYNGNLDINNNINVSFMDMIEREIIIDSFSYTDSTSVCQIPNIVFGLI